MHEFINEDDGLEPSGGAPINTLRQFGNIDIYLFDQLLKGRFSPEMTILDAGCGGGRNLEYFMHNGYNVYGVDSSKSSIEDVKRMALALGYKLPSENFRVEQIEALSFANSAFDRIICNAVLHFADDEKHFNRMILAMWRVLKFEGIFFARLASSIGIEDKIRHLHGRRYRLPDGSTRFLVDEEMLAEYIKKLPATLIEPIKTVSVQNQRCMTTWVLRKPADLKVASENNPCE